MVTFAVRTSNVMQSAGVGAIDKVSGRLSPQPRLFYEENKKLHEDICQASEVDCGIMLPIFLALENAQPRLYTSELLPFTISRAWWRTIVVFVLGHIDVRTTK